MRYANGPLVDRFALVGHVLEGRFRVERLIAERGFGVVYAARHVGLDLPVALKVLRVPAEMNTAARAEFIEEFLLEAKAVARIRHPHIVQVLDTGAFLMPDGERAPWIVLEWLDGYRLSREFAKRPSRPPGEVLALLRPVFQAVACMHDENIAHRDVKPHNVMMVGGRRGTHPKLLDFGIAKLMQTALGAFSPYYAAPEQIGQSRTGPWTDVHALGLIVAEALMGHPVLPHGELPDTIREIYSETRPTPAKFGADVGAWEPVLARALAYKPDLRYPNAAEFLAALEATLPGARLALTPSSGIVRANMALAMPGANSPSASSCASGLHAASGPAGP